MTPPVPASTVGLLAAVFAPPAADTMIVLRNAEQLPAGLSGTDLDVASGPGLKPWHVADHIESRAREAGWVPVVRSTRAHMVAVSVARPPAETEPPVALHFDIFEGIRFLGLSLCPTAQLFAESVVTSGVRTLTARGQVLATLAHHLAWNGGLRKQKYRKDLAQLLANPRDADWLRSRLEHIFGKRIAAEVTDPEAVAGLGQQRRLRKRRVRRELLITSLRQRPVRTLGPLLRYLMGQVASFIHPPGLIGRSGEGLLSLPFTLDLVLACQLSPHGMYAPHARAQPCVVATLNGPRYEESVRRLWARSRLLRWVAPSVFLWLQAKRGRVVVVDRLPWALVTLRAAGGRPRWLTQPELQDVRG